MDKYFRMKKISAVVFLLASASQTFAQSGTNSPYSQFGLGTLVEQTSGFNRGMNGLGLGFRERNQVNFLNPASYSGLDSLSFIFDAGASLQMTHFSENGMKKNANNANFDYIVGAFRAAKNVGVSFGLIPLTSVGYNYSNTSTIGVSSSAVTTSTNTYNGEGGLRQAYLGVGWQPLKGLSVGANISYLWGSYEKSVVNSYNDASIKTLSQYYTADIRSYKFDLGLQYTAKVSKKDWLTIGATFSPGHDIGGNPELNIISTNNQTGVADTLSYNKGLSYSLPTSFGIGFSWNRNNRLKFGVDYTQQRWSSVEAPLYVVTNNVGAYEMKGNLFNDRHKVTVGADYCPQENGRNFFKRMHYRGGVSYTTPYVKVNGVDGPKEISASLGFGMPIINSYNNRSMLNVSVQWVNSSATSLIKENVFRINIGLTFNERWFMKWKVE